MTEAGAGAGAEQVYSHASALRGWAHGYLTSFGWVLAAVWEERAGGGCACPEGGVCAAPGKHLVVDLGQARSAEDVDRMWADDDERVMEGRIGIAAMTGPDSGLLVLDVAHPDDRVLAAQIKLDGDVLTQVTPSGAAHWLFKMAKDETVSGGSGRGKDLHIWQGARVIADGGWIVLAPRAGYTWSGGAEALRKRQGWKRMPEGLRRVLEQKGVLTARGAVDVDQPWLTQPGVPLLSVGTTAVMRSLNKRGFARRVVDIQGNRIAWTRETGFRVWTESGWTEGEGAVQQLESFANDDLAAQLWLEQEELRLAGNGDAADKTEAARKRAANAGLGGIISLIRSDERITVPSENDWNKEPHIVGLPVRAGRGWLLNLRTGEIEHDARTRRVNRQLGPKVEWSGWEDGAAAWRAATAVPKIIGDLESSQGPDWLRLMQRALGMSLMGRAEGVGDCFYLLMGPTRSGKSTLLETFLAVMGTDQHGYGSSMSQNLLFESRTNADFSIASIQHKRVLLMSEPPTGAELNGPMLKTLTGGDTVTGRHPFGRESVTFRPQAALWLATNHPIRIQDDALWERLRPFEFRTQWLGGAADPTLRDRATGEAVEQTAMLWWLLRGVQDWLAEGWGDVGVWDRTRADMKMQHDPLERWLSGALVITGAAGDAVGVPEAVQWFRGWCVGEGEEAAARMDMRLLTQEIKNRMGTRGMTWDSDARVMRGGVLR